VIEAVSGRHRSNDKRGDLLTETLVIIRHHVGMHHTPICASSPNRCEEYKKTFAAFQNSFKIPGLPKGGRMLKPAPAGFHTAGDDLRVGSYLA
jgi:hypothetical protein